MADYLKKDNIVIRLDTIIFITVEQCVISIIVDLVDYGKEKIELYFDTDEEAKGFFECICKKLDISTTLEF